MLAVPVCTSEDSVHSVGNVGSKLGAQRTDKKHYLEDILKDINDREYNKTDLAEFVWSFLLAFHERHYQLKNMTAMVEMVLNCWMSWRTW